MDINLAVSERVVARLRRRGYTVDLLEEFDSQIENYRADIFLSIHVDSCVPGLSGFKIARSQTSAIPEVIESVLDTLPGGRVDDLDGLLAVDAEARRRAEQSVAGRV